LHQTINKLLKTPRQNFLSLVLDPSQKPSNLECTQPEVQPFETGFLGYTGAQIRDFIANRLPADMPSNIEPCQYAILDQRSARDDTVIIAHSYSTLQDKDPEAMTEEERERWEQECEEVDEENDEDDAWFEWRVSFQDVERLATIVSFEDDFTIKLYNRDFVATHTNADGVLQLRSAFEAWSGAAIKE
jgi:hypothetical protein